MKRTSPHQKQRQVEKKKEVKENERGAASPAIQLLFFFKKTPVRLD
jgi:hypothetical protein